MPRVSLTDAQRRELAAKDVYQAILDELNAKRGRERKTNQDFAEDLGISARTWNRWNNGGLGKAEFGVVLDVALQAGLKLAVISNHREEKPA